MNTMDFADVRSAAPAGHTAADRVDPYWAGVWEQGSSAAWLSANLARRQAQSGLGRIPAWMNQAEDQLVGSLNMPRRRDARLGAMSAIDVWRTLTGEQLAAFTGFGELANPRAAAMGELFAAGICDIGQFNTGLAYAKSAGNIYRPSRTNRFDRDIAPRLTYPEWVSVTAGHPWESGSQYDRHNILAAELALRVAEWCEIGAVTGEKLSSWDMLAHTGAGFAPQSGVQRAADATLIRTDGARIAVELTASTGKSFDRKVRGWAQLLSNRRMADTGLLVVFVVATRPDKLVNTGEVMTQVRQSIANACRDNPGVNFDRTAARIFVADWRDWFPTTKQLAPGFLSLEAQRPTGPSGDLWEKASMLDPFDTPFEATDDGRARSVLDNLSLIRSVPPWLRTGRGPVLWPHPIKELGFTGIPVPAPSELSRHVGLALGAGKGSVGPTRPPARLLAVTA